MILILAIYVFFIWSNVIEGYQHPGGMHPQRLIDSAKWRVANKIEPYYTAAQHLFKAADAAFSHTHHALADFTVPGYYVDKETHMRNSAGIQSDSFDAYACALAYHITGGQSKYADQALKFLKAWANINTKYSELDGSLVMSYSGGGLVIAGELLYNYGGWLKEDRAKFLRWVENVYKHASNTLRIRENNTGDWGRFGSLLAAYLLDNTTEINENIRLFKSFFSHKIAPEGHLPSETKREVNGIWYTYFALAPLTASSWMIYQTTGQNLFTNYTVGGVSIKKALDSLLYYHSNPNKWTWYANPRTRQPTESWPLNLFEAMSAIYGDYQYTEFVKNERPITYKVHHTGWTFPTLMRPEL